jgi:hypothetical protein
MLKDTKPYEPTPLSSAEALTLPDGMAPATLADFWRWSLSALWDDGVRGILAEFLVAHALGLAGAPRKCWEEWDIITPRGLKIEVKSSAYLQAWTQERISSVGFSGLRSFHYEAGKYASTREFHCHAIVFGVLDVKDPAHATPLAPLDLTRWRWYPVSVPTFAQKFGNVDRIGAIQLDQLGACPYGDLALRIKGIEDEVLGQVIA